MQETQIHFLGWEEPLEKEIATCSGILAWESPWIEELGGLQSMGLQRVGHDVGTKEQQQQHTDENRLGWEKKEAILSLDSITKLRGK